MPKLLSVKNDYWNLYYNDGNGWKLFEVKPSGKFKELHYLMRQLPQLSMKIMTYGEIKNITICERKWRKI